jgi:hypothetical protein
VPSCGPDPTAGASRLSRGSRLDGPSALAESCVHHPDAGTGPPLRFDLHPDRCRRTNTPKQPSHPGSTQIATDPDVARMSCPSRSKRSVVRTMSSCNGVPTIWAIKPIRTAGCAIRISCNGEPAALAVPLKESMGCTTETSCNAVPTRRSLRQYPGWRDRHAWTRATFTGPRK